MPNALRIALALTLMALPIVEIALIIKAIADLGWLAVMTIIVVTAIAGVNVLRQSGFAAVARTYTVILEGGSPVSALLDQFLVVSAGMLLIWPGFIGDVIGLMLALPPVRSAVVKAVSFGMSRTGGASRPRAGSHNNDGFAQQAHSGAGGARDGERTPIIIEGEYERLDDDDKGAGGGGPANR